MSRITRYFKYIRSLYSSSYSSFGSGILRSGEKNIQSFYFFFSSHFPHWQRRNFSESMTRPAQCSHWEQCRLDTTKHCSWWIEKNPSSLDYRSDSFPRSFKFPFSSHWWKRFRWQIFGLTENEVNFRTDSTGSEWKKSMTTRRLHTLPKKQYRLCCTSIFLNEHS